MKIAIASSGQNLDSLVDLRFGRCPYFLIVDSKTEEFEVMENSAGQAFRGAGISAAQVVANKGVKAVIAGNFGPKAVSVLSASGIKILSAVNTTIREALEKYKTQGLKEINLENIAFGRGMGRGGGRGQRKN